MPATRVLLNVHASDSRREWVEKFRDYSGLSKMYSSNMLSRKDTPIVTHSRILPTDGLAKIKLMIFFFKCPDSLVETCLVSDLLTPAYIIKSAVKH